MKCWRCGNDTTTIETTVNLCTDCHHDYLAGGRLHMPTPDPIDHASAQPTPPRLTDEEVWLRAWEATGQTPSLLTCTTTIQSTDNGSETRNEYMDGAAFRADACLAAFRERFRKEDAETT